MNQDEQSARAHEREGEAQGVHRPDLAHGGVGRAARRSRLRDRNDA